MSILTHKYYKVPSKGNQVRAYLLDGSEDAFIPNDAIRMTEQEVEAFLNPPPTMTDYQVAVQAFMDQEAQVYGYDGVSTAVTYAEEPAVTKFQDEGQAFRAWRSLVWKTCYDLLDRFFEGEIPQPSIQDVLDALPELTIEYRE